MRNDNITRLTLAGMFAALAFVCFTYLRIEIPMGGGMTGKIYIGHAFILLSALILGAKYGAPYTASVGVISFLYCAGDFPISFLNTLLKYSGFSYPTISEISLML